MLRVRAAVCRSWRGFKTVPCAAVEVKNEPILSFKEGSHERVELLKALASVKGRTEEIPCVVGDEHVWTKSIRYQLSPFNHSHKVAKFCYADKELINKAITASVAARKEWDLKPVEDRAQILFKAADVISGPRRAEILAKTMIGQGKTVVQAEIDAAAELIDFFRFNAKHAIELQQQQPLDAEGSANTTLYRGLEGFVAAVAPFNFTAIGGNLAGTPALMGNVVLWKPSDTAMSASYTVYKILRECGMPPNIIQFLPADGPVFGDTITASEHLAGINFTGSVPTFKRLWKQVAQNLDIYRTFPRLAGECGGKNFHFVHMSADIQSVVTGTIRSAFEYGGQKCSACSRMYVPDSLWPQIKEQLLAIHKDIRVGDPVEDFSTFLSAVIDDKSFGRIKKWLEHAKSSPNLKVIAGGNCDDKKGYFVEPTIIETKDPQDAIMNEEGDRRSLQSAEERSGKLLHQRQIHRLHRGSAAVRGRQSFSCRRCRRSAPEPDMGRYHRHRYERQTWRSSLRPQVDVSTDREADARPPHRVEVPLHGLRRSPSTRLSVRPSAETTRGPIASSSRCTEPGRVFHPNTAAFLINHSRVISKVL
uniref:Multifunctional fusion protein n=1 Tax=Oreochromis niloticus TaxID=8128 RepID=A0A669DZU3_ORENI